MYILFNAHDAFLENSSSGTYCAQSKDWKINKIQKSLGESKPKGPKQDIHKSTKVAYAYEKILRNYIIQGVSEWLLFNANSSKLIVNEMMMRSALY